MGVVSGRIDPVKHFINDVVMNMFVVVVVIVNILIVNVDVVMNIFKVVVVIVNIVMDHLEVVVVVVMGRGKAQRGR